MYIGIDPGLKGAFAGLRTVSGEMEFTIDMPTIKVTKTKLEYDVKGIVRIFHDLICGSSLNLVFFEKVQTLPKGFTIKSNTGLAFCEGIFVGLFEAFNVGYQLVNPREWMNHFGISSKRGDTGIQSYQIASRLFPKAELRTLKGRILDGRSDALLIAEYGRRQIIGKAEIGGHRGTSDKKKNLKTCPRCQGAGAFLAGHNVSESIDCWECKGTGKVPMDEGNGG